MPGDPRLGIVLSGPQAALGISFTPRGHARQVPPPTTTAPRSPHATALRFRCPAPRRPDHLPVWPNARASTGRTAVPGRTPTAAGLVVVRTVRGVPGSGPAPPGHLPSGGRCHVPAGPRSSPWPRLQNPTNGVGERPPLVRRTPRRPRDRRVRCCRYRRPTTQPRTTDHPQGLGQDGRKWHVPGRIPSELQDVGARTAHSLDAG